MTNSFVLAKGKLPQNLVPYCAKLSTYKGHSDLKLYESLSIGFSNPFNPDLYYHKGDIISTRSVEAVAK